MMPVKIRDVIFGGIETGGTKIVVSISKNSPLNIVDSITFRTTTPQEVIDKAVGWLKTKSICSLGIAGFGPLDLDPDSPTYGCVTATPKVGWRNADLLLAAKALNVPVMLQTDVNAAALSEIRYGGHGDISSCCYITVGTGVGVGIVIDKKPLFGLSHPEGGHIQVRRHPNDKYKGNCPFHKDCLEGLANARSVADRVGCAPLDIRKYAPEGHEVWNLISFYIAQLCVSLSLTVSPKVIVLGGGIMQKDWVVKAIRKNTLTMLNGYLPIPKITENTNSYILRSQFGERAGVIGSLELSRLAMLDSWKGDNKTFRHSSKL